MPKQNDKVGPYTLISKLGRGGFGVVWLAEKRSFFTTVRVAIKFSDEDDINLEAIGQEASLWAEASGHPNVLPIIDADIYDEHVVIISEYASGGPLNKWLEKYGGKAPSIESAIKMIDGILAGLEHLHSKDIIHRDLKPDNILLQNDCPRLADFGIARILKTTSPKYTNVSGTFPYMAPEAFKGKRSEQTDLWAVGIIFYEMLVGEWPFQGDQPTLIHEILYKELPQLPPNIPEALKRVIIKSLQKDETLRYKSASEMRAALNSAIKPQNLVNVSATEFDVPTRIGSEETLRLNQALIPTQRYEPASLTKRLQLEYWTMLHKLLRQRNSIVTLKEPSANYSITGSIGHPLVELVATANIKDGRICVGIWIKHKVIYRALEGQKETIQREISWREPNKRQDFLWLENKSKAVSDIWLRWHGANINQREKWPEYLTWHQDRLEAFFRVFAPRVRMFDMQDAGVATSWHKFVKGEPYKLDEIISICLEHISSGKVEDPDEKLRLLESIQDCGHSNLVFAPQGTGWGASPMNPKCWLTLGGQPIFYDAEGNDKKKDALHIDEPVIAITINQQYPQVRNAEDLYNATRGIWRVSLERANKAKYAFAVYQGIIREVYKIDRWIPASKETREYWKERERAQGLYFPPEVHDGRSEFIGEIAPESIRQKYVGQRMPVPSTQNPIRYINC